MLYAEKSFNLNLLECKFFYCNEVREPSRVLISTYWNVNINCILSVNSLFIVLISTYWNVNFAVGKRKNINEGF